MYINGTSLFNYTGSGKKLRWSDKSTILLGGYALSPTTNLGARRFIGWIDDLCFYNRILSSAEIQSTWKHGGNVSDPSLFIYYDFDEGPGAPVFVNKGIAGVVANLHNGKGFNGSSVMYDAISGRPFIVTEAVSVSYVSMVWRVACLWHRTTLPF